ncbi:MAG: hypothetical protein ACLR7D_12145 [Lachnospira eligens]
MSWEMHTSNATVQELPVVDVISNLSAISEENLASTQLDNSFCEELNATINILAETAAKVKEVSDQLNEDMKYFKM